MRSLKFFELIIAILIFGAVSGISSSFVFAGPYPTPTYSYPTPTYFYPTPTYSYPTPTYSYPTPTYSYPTPAQPVQPAPACPGGECPTGIGSIPTEPAAFVEKILTIALGVAGGIAFLLMVYGAFRLLTSAGVPEGIQEGWSIILSAIAGLLFIIFSVFLLRVIGVDILKIPGFGQ